MPTPTKPFSVLKSEGKSHRSKAELKVREQGEKALQTSQKIKPKKEVKRTKLHTKSSRELYHYWITLISQMPYMKM